ncbi:hypothetical protein COLO4_29333 [Corchorus olitorius]|uniref:HAT C-terminal dimerisation domain-containing protein n=1 Tax=Corchorus olitorius TaxID=93759 RepID=A0A1R3HF69_9ROSI|nr:hypothetical protein COLO4_29333 [Corchorus olitorius]
MYGCEQSAALLASINEALLDLFEDYRKGATPSDKGSEPQKTSQNVAAEIDDDAIDHEVDDSEGDAMAQFYKHQMESGTVQQKIELEIYLQEDREKVNQVALFDVLKWWRLNSPRFPTLSCLARDLLVVPMSTVASESAFSTGGRVLDVYRSSMSSKFVQALVCAQDWMKRSSEFDPMADTDKQAELDQLAQELKNVSLEPIIHN